MYDAIIGTDALNQYMNGRDILNRHIAVFTLPTDIVYGQHPSPTGGTLDQCLVSSNGETNLAEQQTAVKNLADGITNQCNIDDVTLTDVDISCQQQYDDMDTNSLWSTRW
eukprot:SAG11_NODE_993_length_6261_cov_114.016391_4_plen_110_part_00